MERVLRGASVAAVAALGVPPAIELAAIGHPNQRAFGAILLGAAVLAGVYSAIRRRPLGARFTTLVYGVLGVGFGLFVTLRAVTFLLAYAVGLLGMNVLLYHVSAYGAVLASTREEDAVARRTRAVVLRSLALSGAALALAYGGSLALLPAFALDVGLRDPVSALLIAVGLILLLLLVALLPEFPGSSGGKAARSP